jgi:hypothetical protein
MHIVSEGSEEATQSRAFASRHTTSGRVRTHFIRRQLDHRPRKRDDELGRVISGPKRAVSPTSTISAGVLMLGSELAFVACLTARLGRPQDSHQTANLRQVTRKNQRRIIIRSSFRMGAPCC